MNILILGGGAREHAIADALSKSKILCGGKLYCAPGNPGIAQLAEAHDIDICDGEAVVSFCATYDVGLIVVGPEAPLVAGVADDLRAEGLSVFGPGETGAILEGSKAFAKQFMRRHGIPTANFEICVTLDECEAAIDSRKPPYVIKADGLAAGKGVFLPDSKRDAVRICGHLLSDRALGASGAKIVIEDYLPGRELTVLAVTDGSALRVLSPSRDHKRVFDGDKGSNTGGMGAYSPVRLPEGMMDRIEKEILLPTLKGLSEDGIDYRGVIYAGLMLSEDGRTISVVEYNVRFGDPEAQVVLPIMAANGTDFGEITLACAEGKLNDIPVPADAPVKSAVCVVLTSGGYPGEFRKELPIEGLDRHMPDTIVYQAGTRAAGGKTVTSGGRVLSVVGIGDTFEAARRRAYERVGTIRFEGMHFRKDIGHSEVQS